MTQVLGVSCYFHDAAAALVEDGRLVAAAEEERFSRKKHDSSFPRRAIEFCLEKAKLRGRDLDHVAFYENPRLKFRRVLATAAAVGAPAQDAFVGSMTAWVTERRAIRRRLAELLGIPKDRVLFVEHHVSHAASAYFPSHFDSAALLTVDGVGEWATATVGHASTGERAHVFALDDAIDFPHSLGLFYSAITDLLGFEVNEGEYKVMGMAPYGEPRYVEELERVLHLYDDGSFWLDMSYFTFHHSNRRAYSDKLLDLLKIEPRKRNEPFWATEDGAPPGERERSRKYADLAASAQEITERAIVNLARAAHERSGSAQLCFAGGVALNGLANRRILDETPITELFIPPAPGDSGGAYGAALYVEHVLLGTQQRVPLEHAYWGADYDEGEIAAALRERKGLRSRQVDDPDALFASTIDSLGRGEVVGWFQDRFEFGPRALGNRSILADPGRTEMKERINEKIKFREPFRPFAPAAPEDFAASLVPAHEARQHPARFMLLISELDPELGARIPAVNHFGTARIQTVRKEWNPKFSRLLDLWGEQTGLPVLLNTSFNLRGEPIVSSPEDALNTFERSGLDRLVLGNFVVERS
jgi:carbamoyltransferase